MTRHADGAKTPGDHPLRNSLRDTVEESLEHTLDDPDTVFWFNERTGEVEEGPQSIALDRIGPFSTREEAARALEIVAERARKWHSEDD